MDTWVGIVRELRERGWIGLADSALMIAMADEGRAPDLRACPKCREYGHGVDITACSPDSVTAGAN